VTADLFDNITHDRLRALARLGTVRRYRRGATLVEEGDFGSTIFVVLKGRLKAFSQDVQTSHREVSYGYYGVGDMLGEVALDGGPRSASILAIEATICAVVPKGTILEFIKQHPEFAFDLLSQVIARARRATHHVRSLVLYDAYGRLTELLLAQARLQEDGTLKLAERISHQEISDRIGCSREMVSRLLKDLAVGGYLSYDAGKRIVIQKSLPSRW
jgi:CRP/FNR family transcriptional regulator, cyclic AMP receptor protein